MASTSQSEDFEGCSPLLLRGSSSRVNLGKSVSMGCSFFICGDDDAGERRRERSGPQVVPAKTGKRARELIPSLLALIRRHFRHSVVAKAKLWLLRDHGT